MIDFEVKGAIFDVDDTLLDNKSGLPGQGLHEKSRLRAAHEVGRLHGIVELQQLTAVDNKEAFMTAPVHTLQAAVWNIMKMTGLADSDVINPEDPVFQQIVLLKNELHKDIIIEEAEEVAGALAFVEALSSQGLAGRLAVASSSIRRDVDLFFSKSGLDAYFPDDKIITLENITHPKPNPEAFDLAFQSLGLPETDRAEVCAFEDDPRGIMSARAAGLYVCAITTRFTRDEMMALEIPPHLVAESYEEFTELFGLRKVT